MIDAVRVRRILRGVGGLILLLVAWEISVRTGVLSPRIIPRPSALPLRFVQEIQSGIWLRMVASSLSHYGLGWALGTGLGLVVGTAVALVPSVQEWQSIVVRVLRPIPPLAWIPFAIIWFGINRRSAAFIISIGVFWINYFAAVGAIGAVDEGLVDVARVFGHGRFFSRVFRVVLPAASPGIVTGVRTGLGQGWMTVVAAELFGIEGIGQRMMVASGLLAIDVVAIYMFTIALLYGLTEVLFLLVKRTVTAWSRV